MARESKPFAEYPRMLYKRAPVTGRTPNGYITREVASPDEERACGREWVRSPAHLNGAAKTPIEKASPVETEPPAAADLPKATAKKA